MNVAIPRLNNFVAPCFEVAKKFEIAVIDDGKILSTNSVQCLASEEFARIRLLRLYEIHTLICNGIESFYRDQILAMGINVITNINDSVRGTLIRFLAGELSPYETTQFYAESNNIVSHDKLVNWAKKLFEDCGYSVSTCDEEESFLIDLEAKIQCPLCNKPIEVAICCGAQIYRADQEIKEFHHTAKAHYNARVYVYLTNPQIEKSCKDYGIDFISPEISDLKFSANNKTIIPILQRPVQGHEKAFNYNASTI